SFVRSVYGVSPRDLLASLAVERTRVWTRPFSCLDDAADVLRCAPTSPAFRHGAFAAAYPTHRASSAGSPPHTTHAGLSATKPANSSYRRSGADAFGRAIS